MDSKKTLFSKISNLVFLIFTIFALIFIWTNYYLRNFTKSLIFTLILVSIFSVIYFPLYKRKKRKNNELLTSKKQEEYYKTQLILGNDHNIKSYMCKLLEITNFKTHSHFHISTHNKDIFFHFTSDEITNDNIINFYKLSTNNDIVVYCISTPKAYIKTNKKNITFVDFKEIFQISQTKNNFYDENLKIDKSNKISLKTLFCVVLCKKRSKNYIYIGLIILLSSLFTPYNIYYVVFATILFIVSIFARFNTIYN